MFLSCLIGFICKGKLQTPSKNAFVSLLTLTLLQGVSKVRSDVLFAYISVITITTS